MLKKVTAAALLICFSFIVFSGCSKSFAEEGYLKTVETARTEIWKQISAGASSATVAIMDNGKIVYQEGFGMREREKSLPVDQDTQFNIGSVSKIFTAASVLLLVGEGKVELDHPVAEYLPEFTMEDERYRDITVRMLLNHSSGVPGSYAKNAYTTIRDTNIISGTLAYLSQKTLVDDPGEVSIYCNNGFILAQALVEKVSGTSYADYVAKNLFAKAGMSNSSCYFKDGNRNISRVYNPATGNLKPVEYANLMGTGGISSTAVDLCKYASALLSGEIMDEDLLQEYLAPQYAPETVPDGDLLFKFGLGWDTAVVEKYAVQGISALSKNGGTSQYSSILYVLPEENIAVSAIFAGNVNATEVGDTILQAFLEEKEIIPTGDGETVPPSSAPLPEDLLNYEGIYGSNERIVKVSFDTATDSMILSFFGEGGFVQSGVYPYKKDGYFYLENGKRLTFSQDGSNPQCLLIHYADTEGGYVWAEKLDPDLGKAQPVVFEDKSWLPVNLSVDELPVFSAKTGGIDGLPGYIYICLGGTYVPYALASEYLAIYSMKYARDQGEPMITEEYGRTLFKVVGLVFEDADEAAALVPGETVVIEDESVNEIRRIEKDCLFEAQMPEEGRVIVFSSGLDVLYDSLMEGEKALTVSEGSYIVFVGDPGAGFKCDVEV